MMDFTIGEIAEACGGTLVLQKGKGQEVNSDNCVSSVTIDSRKAEPQGVFVAVPGEHVDGHSFAASVFDKGVILVITQKTPEQAQQEHGCPAEEWGSYLLVKDTLQALRDMAEAYRKKLDIKVVGITGSSGKTSTKELTAAVLSEKYHVCKTEGNLNNEIGVPLTLLRIRKEHQVAVVEMGISDFGEMHRLSRMARPDICVITNIGQSHLKDLKTRDGILKAKSEIFDYMAEDGEICLNGEDDKLITLKEVKGHRPHFFGLGGNPEEEVAVEQSVSRGLWGSDVTMLVKKELLKRKGSLDTGRRGKEEQEIYDKPAGNEPAGEGVAGDRLAEEGPAGNGPAGDSGHEAEAARLQLHIPLPGKHMVLNGAAAVCTAELLGLTEEEIAAGLARAVPVGGRDNIIRLPRYTLIDGCYNANPASMTAALDLLAMADTERVAVLGDMFNLGENSGEYHGQMGAYAVRMGIDRIICIGEESRHMYQNALQALDAAENLTSEKKCNVLYYSHRSAFMEALQNDFESLAPQDSTILVKASHGMEFHKILETLQEKGNRK